MMLTVVGKIRNFFRLTQTPADAIKVTWVIFIATGPFLVLALYHQPWMNWVVVGSVGAWAFAFSNSYLHRMYWRNHKLMIQDQQELLNQIQFAFHLLHEHCPNCGQQLKEKEVRQ